MEAIAHTALASRIAPHTAKQLKTACCDAVVEMMKMKHRTMEDSSWYETSCLTMTLAILICL